MLFGSTFDVDIFVYILYCAGMRNEQFLSSFSCFIILVFSERLSEEKLLFLFPFFFFTYGRMAYGVSRR